MKTTKEMFMELREEQFWNRNLNPITMMEPDSVLESADRRNNWNG